MKTEEITQLVEDTEIKVAQARVPLALHKAVGKRLYDEGLGFQWLIVDAFKRYLGEGKKQEGLGDRFEAWLATCHKNPVDYLVAEMACRRAFGLKAEEWPEFQKQLQKK